MTNNTSLFTGLTDQAADGLLALMLAFRADQRLDKLDLGIGVYRDERGGTPVMAAVKAAEKILLETQTTKVYLGSDGDLTYVRKLAEVPLGAARAADPRLVGMQTPGGTGALRLAAELIAANTASGRVWMGTPTWSNHKPIFAAAGVEILEHPFYDPSRQQLDLDAMLAALGAAREGDAVLLHGCCHNPSAADLTPGQWSRIADIVERRRLIPIVDLAYQGLGRGIEEDAHGTRLLFDRAEAMILAYSCDKNFGLYRERTGALWVKAPDEASAPKLAAAMRNPARSSWSMPPDHGAAVVRIILESDDLTRIWREELDHMRGRLAELRSALAAAHPALAGLAGQTGMFAMLPISREAVMALRADQGIYIADDGRINVAGLTPAALSRLAEAVAPRLDAR